MESPSSSDEGEIVENRGGSSKATSLPQIDGHGVDRMDRTRARLSRSRSPEHLNGLRHRPATSRRSRSPRGLKRSHDDRDSYRGGRIDPDPRRFRVHYEDSHDHYRRARISYDDEDRPPSRSSATTLHYDDRDRSYGRDRASDRARDRSQDRDRYSDKRPRNRTRSPYNSSRGDRDRGDHSRRDNDRLRRETDRNGVGSIRSSHQASPRPVQDSPEASKQSSTVKTTETTPSDAHSISKGLGNTLTYRSAKASEPENGFEEKPVDVDAELERRRRRRQELLAKSRATPMLVQALQSSEKANGLSPTTTRGSTPMATDANTPQSSKNGPISKQISFC